MKKYPLTIIISFLVAMLALDLYVFKGIGLLTAGLEPLWRNITLAGFWGFTVFLVPAILITALNFKTSYHQRYQVWVSFLVGLTLLSVATKVVFAVFLGLGDLGHVASLAAQNTINGETLPDGRGFITRLGLAAAVVPFVSISYGMIKGKYKYRVIGERLSFEHLPQVFHGLRIVHISDLHLGSFNKKYGSVERGIEMINAMEPDLILFTGDIVNNYAQETEGWHPVLSRLQARHGKYAVLGNHDYGDYGTWPDELSKQQNAEAIRQFVNDCGFRLLLNESEKITIGEQSITLIGVENWGLPPFKQYGNLQQALAGVDEASFKVLLSHDPSHWDAEVRQHTNIDLTLAGHTHGAQFGVEVGNIKWSPIRVKYPRWGGLYTEGKQHLYVNRGFGFHGFPGRVGMAPEITSIELEAAAA